MKRFTLIVIIGILLSFNSFAQPERELASSDMRVSESLAHMSVASSTCDYKVEIIIDDDEFESQDFKWRMRATKIEGKSTNITGTAEIEDSNGKTVKTYKPWTSDSIAKQKTSSEYSPNLKPGKYEITAEISVECEDTNKDNNVDTKEIKIKGEEETKSKKSKSDDIIDKEVQNQKSTTIDTNKENTITTSDRNIVSGELKNQRFLSKSKKPTSDEETESTIELKSQNTNQNIQLPITTNIIQSPQNTETVYESSGERAKQWIMIFLLTLSILLNIILIWRR